MCQTEQSAIRLFFYWLFDKTEEYSGKASLVRSCICHGTNENSVITNMKNAIYKFVFVLILGMILGYLLKDSFNQKVGNVVRAVTNNVPAIAKMMNTNSVPISNTAPSSASTNLQSSSYHVSLASHETATLYDHDKNIVVKFVLFDAPPDFIKVVKPTKDEILKVGRSYVIEWQAKGKFSKVWISTINARNSAGKWVATDIPDTGKFEWTPNERDVGTFKISLWSIGSLEFGEDGGMSAESDLFTVEPNSP